MRYGKLLAQSKPEDLIKAFNVDVSYVIVDPYLSGPC